MDKQSIIEGNMIIAKFMNMNDGWAFHELDEKGFGYVKYHHSWDWLMPVWTKVRESYFYSVGYTQEFSDYTNKLYIQVFNANIEEFWRIIIDLITHHTTINKEK